MSWDAIIRHYRKRPQTGREFDRFSSRCNMPTLEVAIETAALSKDENGHIYSHQQRPWNRSPGDFRKAAKALVHAVKRIEACRSFDALLTVVEAVLKETFGESSNKELFVYDVAFRIGAWRDVLPERVYLHRGTREGPKALGIETKGRRAVPVAELPPQLHPLPPWQLEDILCIYRKRFPKQPDARCPHRRFAVRT